VIVLESCPLLMFFTNNAYGNKECSSLLCRFLYPSAKAPNAFSFMNWSGD
jgi:hypothetical protein